MCLVKLKLCFIGNYLKKKKRIKKEEEDEMVYPWILN